MFAAELLESALALLNSGSGTNPASRHQAWKLIDDSAEMGNVDAKVKIGVSKLLGTYYQQVSCELFYFFTLLCREVLSQDAEKGS